MKLADAGEEVKEMVRNMFMREKEQRINLLSGEAEDGSINAFRCIGEIEAVSGRYGGIERALDEVFEDSISIGTAEKGFNIFGLSWEQY